MVCSLPAPQWENPYRIGLRSAIELPAESVIKLTWESAIPVTPGELVQFIIYYSEDSDTLFNEPKAFSEANDASIPMSLANDGYYFAVRASQLGIASTTSDLSNLEIGENAFAFPNPTTLKVPYTNYSLVFVNDATGFPDNDGYLQIGDEVILYSSIIDGYDGTGFDGYDGYDAFVVSNRNPFGCNEINSYPIGTTVRLFKGFEENNEIHFQNEDVCALQQPIWADPIYPGIKLAEDLGIGTAIRVGWDPAITPAGMSDTYYNVYSSSIVDTLFDSPIGITKELSVIVPDRQPGDGYYFGVRATYFNLDFDITSLVELSDNFYKYPVVTTVDEFDGYYTEQETGPLVVSSISGYPTSGLLKVGSEFISYGSHTLSTFIVGQRDVFGRDRRATHANGTLVSLFKGIEDTNQVWYRVMPTWDGNGSEGPRLPADGYQDVTSMQDEEGYRAWKFDDLNENHQPFEEGHEDTAPLPLCGYRARDYAALFTRNACGTYSGGRPDGFGGGINVNESNLQREEFLLSISGEPVTLLRQKTIGRQCPAFSLRAEHATERCGLCFGTKILGGYDQYFHDRRFRPDLPNPSGMFNIRVNAYKNDLPLIAHRALSQVDELTVWFPGVPFVKKRDVIIRYVRDEDGNILEEEFRYEVTSVTRGKIILGFDGKQEAIMRKLDVTHSIYQFPVDLP